MHGGLLKNARLRFYTAGIAPASQLLRRLGMLCGPRFWLPLRMGQICFRLPLMGGVGLELSTMGYSWKTSVLECLVPLRPGLFVDVGSHLGETLLDLRFASPKTPYLGFEPLCQCVCYLQALIRMNAFSDVLVQPCGLSDAARLATLYTQSETDAAATLHAELRPQRKLSASHAPVFRFDDIRSVLGVDTVGFVKIDVEGHELEALQGMARTLEQDRAVILCEVLFANAHADLEADRERKRALYESLVNRDYSVWQLHKSEDGNRVESVVSVAGFTVEFWTEQNAELCDYLFLPREYESAALEALYIHPR